MSTTFSTILRNAMAERGLTSAEVASRMGVSAAAVAQWLSGRTLPKFSRVVDLAKVVGWDPLEFVRAAEAKDAGPNARVAPDAPRMPVVSNLPRDVPVLGSAQAGSDGAFELNMDGQPVDFVRRPNGLAGMDVFAIFIEGDSMVPWREPGDFVYVHPTRPPAIGDYVVVLKTREDRDPTPTAWIKRLKRRTADKIITEQFNPAVEVVFERTPDTRVLRVIDWKEALGM